MPSAVGGIVGGLLGGGTPSAPNVQTFQPSGTQQADTSFQTLINQMLANNPYDKYAPQATATFDSAYKNPYAPGYQASANTAGAAYGAAGATAGASAPGLTKAGDNALTASNQVLNMGFDPQNALYQQSLQKLNDTTNAGQAQRGITNSPYGQSVSDTANTNFNIDWQNNQLTKAIQALSGYTSGVAGANADYTGANTLATAGAADIAKSGALPFAASTDITNSQSAAMNQLLSILGNSGAGAWDSTSLDQLMSYLKLGAGQSNQQGEFDLANYANALKQSQASQSGLGSLVSSGADIVGQIAGQEGPTSIASLLSLLAA